VKHLFYLSPAEVELVEAAEYYDSEREGLGRVFLDAVRAAEQRVRRNPKMWASRLKAVRSCRVQRFPYRLHYVDERDRVVVVAVAHTSRRPGYWKNRLD
jgi:toxin ParE1/3/4